VVRFLVRIRDLSLRPSIQTASGAHPTSHSTGIPADVLTEVRRPKRETNHSSPFIAEEKKVWNSASLGVPTDNFTFFVITNANTKQANQT